MFIKIENEIINVDHIFRAEFNEEGDAPELRIVVPGGSKELYYSDKSFRGDGARKLWEMLQDVTGTR